MYHNIIINKKDKLISFFKLNMRLLCFCFVFLFLSLIEGSAEVRRKEEFDTNCIPLGYPCEESLDCCGVLFCIDKGSGYMCKYG